MRKHRISPATAISLVALFFSLAGTGVAAQHYLVTSVRQIAPRVRHQLRGQRGPRGPRGPAGPAGAPGPAGATTASRPAIALGGAYVVTARADLTAESPYGAVAARCNQGDVVVGGGFDGANEAVTGSRPLLAYAPTVAWRVSARLASTPRSITADTTAGSAVLGDVTGALSAGDEVSGPGVPPGAYVETAGGGTAALTSPATATASQAQLTARADGYVEAWAMCAPSGA